MGTAMNRLRVAAVVLALSLSLCEHAPADDPPVIPVGLDAIRQWERWPVLRIGARTYMRSTYDRSGGNEGADASHFLYQEAEDRNVVSRPSRARDRLLHPVQPLARQPVDARDRRHGARCSRIVHGRSQPSSDGATFLPANLFPEPLAFTWAATRGADLSWVPMPFEKSYRLSYGRTHYGTGYFIYQQFVPGARLSSPIRSWDFQTPPQADVLAASRPVGHRSCADRLIRPRESG